MYPEFTFRRLAPRIDATRREETSRDVTYREASDRDRESGIRPRDVAGLLGGEGTDRSRYSSDIDRFLERLQRDLERRRRIDRERRGL